MGKKSKKKNNKFPQKQINNESISHDPVPNIFTFSQHSTYHNLIDKYNISIPSKIQNIFTNYPNVSQECADFFENIQSSLKTLKEQFKSVHEEYISAINQNIHLNSLCNAFNKQMSECKYTQTDSKLNSCTNPHNLHPCSNNSPIKLSQFCESLLTQNSQTKNILNKSVSNDNTSATSSKFITLIFYALSDTIELTDILTAMSNINISPNYEIIVVSKNKLLHENKFNWILKFPYSIAKKLLQLESININAYNYQVKVYVYIKRCYICQSFMHISSACSNTKVCSVCSLAHSIDSKYCRNPPKCVNCIRYNEYSKANFKISHPAYAPSCPSLKNFIENKRQNITDSILNSSD